MNLTGEPKCSTVSKIINSLQTLHSDLRIEQLNEFFGDIDQYEVVQ